MAVLLSYSNSKCFLIYFSIFFLVIFPTAFIILSLFFDLCSPLVYT